MKTNKKNKILLTAIIITYISLIVNIFALTTLIFNLFEITDMVEVYLKEYLGTEDVGQMLTMYYIEMFIAVLVNIYAVRSYSKIYKYRLNNKDAGRYLTSVAIWQLLFTSWVPSVFGFIAGIQMMKRKVQIQTTPASPYLSDYKLNAMSEAIERLKELRDKGAISEEEYYASLNKVLEG
jgi:hypothetical protein